MNEHAFQADKKDFLRLCLFQSFPAECTPKKTAGKSRDYYLKEAEKKELYALIKQMEEKVL